MTVKKSKDTTRKISITERVEMLYRGLNRLNELCDQNSARGNKTFEEIGQRLDKLEKANLCKKCEWIKKYDRCPTVVDTEAPQLHNENCDLKKFNHIENKKENAYCLTCKTFEKMGIKSCHQETLSSQWTDITPKPKVGEIWRTAAGYIYLIIEYRKDGGYYIGSRIKVKSYWFKSCEIIVDDNLKDMVLFDSNLIKKIL